MGLFMHRNFLYAPFLPTLPMIHTGRHPIFLPEHPEKVGIIPEAALLTGRGQGGTGPDHFVGCLQAEAGHILVDRYPGAALKGVHEIIAVHVEIVGQGIDGHRLGQMLQHILLHQGHQLDILGILVEGVDGRVVVVLVDLHEQLG